MIATRNPGFIERYEKSLIAVILLVGLILRLGWVWIAPRLDPVIREEPLHGDSAGYHLLAVNLLQGNGLSWDGEHLSAYRMPVYPYFLALIYKFSGANKAAVRFVQAILGVLTIIPVFLAGKTAGGRTIGLLSGLGTAFHPLLIYMTGWIYTESLFILVLWAAILALIQYIYNGKPALGLLTGVGFGIASLIRPEVYPFLLFLACVGYLLRWRKELIKGLVVAQLIVIVVVLPWSIRSSLIFKTLTPLSTSGGMNFKAGNNPESKGGSMWIVPHDGLTEIQSNRQFFIEGITWIRDNPGRALMLIPQKARKFFSPIEFETRENPLGQLVRPVNVIYSGFLILALYGGIILRRHNTTIIIMSVILWYLITAIIFYGGSRVALPISPGLMIFGSSGLVDLAGRIFRRRYK